MDRKLICMILLIIPIISFGGPFGVDKGDMPSMPKFKDFVEVNDQPNFLVGANPPKAHSSFEKYAVRFSSATGACWVKAIGKDIDSDAYGTSTKLEADKIAAQISSKYGKSKKTDRLAHGSIWDDADDWMMGIRQNERFYMHIWDADSGSNLEGTDIESIALIVRATDRTDGYIVAEFSFDNKKTCEDEENQKGEDSF